MSSINTQRVCLQFADNGVCSFGIRCKYDHILTISRQKKIPRNRRTSQPGGSPDYLNELFKQYPEFPYNHSAPVMNEFYRMCDFFKWDKEDKARETAREELKDALTKQFNGIYGTDVNDIDAWQKLCRVLEIIPIPAELQACREAVRKTYVNLVDLVDMPKTNEPVTIFKSEMELSVYTKASGKFFPRENAYAGGLLKYLLRRILTPAADNRSSKSKRNRRGRK